MSADLEADLEINTNNTGPATLNFFLRFRYERTWFGPFQSRVFFPSLFSFIKIDYFILLYFRHGVPFTFWAKIGKSLLLGC
jgi:hypothetical protein